MGLVTQSQEEQKVLGFNSTLDFASKQEESDTVEQEKPSFVETLGASFADETSIGSALTGDVELPYWMSGEQADLNFDPAPFITDKYTGYEDDFLLANNEQEAIDIQKELDRQIEYDEITQASGAMGIATDVAVQFVDPINYIPFLNSVKASKGTTVGKRVLETAWNFGKAGFIATASQEAILQATQRGRSDAESAVAIGSATLLSGLMGAGVGKWTAKMDNLPDREVLDETFYKEFAEQPDDIPAMESVPLGDSTVGAMKFEEVSLEDLKPAKGFTLVDIIAKTPVYRSGGTTFDPFTNPLMRMMYNSQSKEARLATLKLTEFPLRLQGHESGNLVSPPNASSAIRRDQSEMTLPAMMDLEAGFSGYKKRMKADGIGALSRKDFNNEVWMAMNKGDESSIPEVKSVAQSIRKNVLAPALDELRAMGRDLPDAPGKAESYVMRNYNAKAIRSDETGFIDILAEQFARDVEKAEELEQEAIGVVKSQQKEKRVQSRLLKEASTKIKKDIEDSYLSQINRIPNEFDGLIDKVTPKKTQAKKSKAKKSKTKKSKTKKSKTQANAINSLKSDLQSTVRQIASMESSAITKRVSSVIGDDLSQEQIAEVVSKVRVGTAPVKSMVDDIMSQVEKSIRASISKGKKTEGDVLSQALIKARKDARDASKKIISEQTKSINENIKKIEGVIKAQKKQIKKLKAQQKLSLDDLREIAREVSTKIQGLPANRHVSALEFDLSSVAKSAGSAQNLKKRSLQLDDDIVERLVNGGFIDTDIELAVKKYMGTVMRDVRIAQHIGDVDGTKMSKVISDDYDDKITLIQGQQQKVKNNPKELASLKKQEKKLRKQRDADLADFKGMVDRVNGTYNANQTSFESVAKNLNTMRLMGSMLESALPDVARIGLTQASSPIFRQSVGKLKNIIANPAKYRMDVKQAQALAVATDRTLGGRMAHISDIADDMYLDQGRGVTSAISDYTGKFFNHIGANHWNETWETITSTALSSEAMDAAGRFVAGKASPEDMAKFAEGGMDKAQIRTVHKFFKAHGEKDGALSILNLDKWVPETIEEKKAINAFKDMIARATEILIIQPGQDTSLWGSKGFGSMVMQFKGFGQASIMRSTALYGQRIRKNPLDYRNYVAATSQIAMGASVTALRLYLGYLAGSTMWETAKDWSTERWVLEGVDRSGMLGAISETYNSLLQPVLSAAGVPGTQPLTRFQQRNVVDRTLGPTAGLLTDTIFGAFPTAAKTLTGQTPTQAEIKATRRILPYQNYIGLRYLLDGGMREGFDEFNIPKSDKKATVLPESTL